MDVTGPATAVVAASGPDLDACAREPIHAPGAIQPHGCLLLCSVPAWTIEAASGNAEDFLGLEARTLLGRAADAVLPPKTLHDLRNVLQASLASGSAERLLDAAIDGGGERYDLSTHMAGTRAVIEIVPRAGAQALSSEPITLVRSMMGRLRRAPSLERFLHFAAQQVRAVTGFERVMVYRFREDHSGEVVAEALRSGLEPFLGLRYPASDIPPQARELYLRQWLRLIPDVDYAPVPLVSDRAGAGEFDLSLAMLRSASPIHLEYLRNMGSRATLTLSIVMGDRLWGLIACHHHVAPRRIAASTCAAIELFAQIFSSALEAREQARVIAAAGHARDLCARLAAPMTPVRTVFDDLPAFAEDLKALIPCDGMATWSDGRIQAVGMTPPADAIPDLVAWLDARAGGGMLAASAIGALFPPAQAWTAGVSGLLAIPFRRSPPTYLLLFRREVAQAVTWGGDPEKPVDDDGIRIGPRKSFAAWQQIVRGTAPPWSETDIGNGDALRVSLLELILRRADLVEENRRAARDSQTILIAELNHRVRNILALIRSLVRQSRPGARNLETYAEDLEHRIGAMALAHDQLTIAPGNAAPIQTLFEAEARAWLHSADRVTLRGPPVTLNARAYQTLALVVHEMMTNAAKYGSLSEAAGRLDIAWSRDPARDLRVTWTERGGPPVAPPGRRGFGSFIVGEVIAFELGGEARVEYDRDGVLGHFVIPAAHVAEGAADPAPTRPERTVDAAVFKGGRLLLVEDSMMIALDARAMLVEEGLEVEIAGTMAEARRFLASERFDGAVLDVNLSGERSFGLGDECARQGIPFVFATGYGEGIVRPDRFKSVPVVSKPYDVKALKGALGAVRFGAPGTGVERRPRERPGPDTAGSGGRL